ncbi:hypothetical protein J5N97_007694 [Dioscorea zingiberensis]|uniref:Uncharacterized protein n=1 Tax=Dioscorea zingiberensis TaxID=325984 RepID=A0A9D5DCD2_9LILI|nr:hypothetical protein J5N97_007694 [Dioscorea zingiberensis]
MCIESASADPDSVERWRRQRRTLERLPAHLADGLLRSLRQRRLLFPSLLEVFQHCVEEVELNGENSVDAEWMAYLGAFRHLLRLSIADCKGVNNSALWALTGMGCLKELDLSRCSRITDTGIKHLLSIPNLEKLFISETGLTTDGVMLVCSFKNLVVLDMGGLPVTDEALCSLQALTQLEHLDLWGSKISDDGAVVLKMFPRLSFLNLAWTNVTKLPYLPSITCLNMSNCVIHSISPGDTSQHAPLSKLLVHGATFVDVDEVFSNLEGSYITFLDISQSSICSFLFLNNMKGLQHLDLSFCAITDDLVEHVAFIGGNLKSLSLSNTKITSLGLSVLAGCVINLQTLSLSYTTIDDTALSYISMLHSLYALDLSHTNIKGFTYRSRDSLDKIRSFSLLQNLIHLESLNLEDTLVRDEAIQPLSLLQELKSLHLKSDFLSDIALHALSTLPKLKFLGFRGAVLTDSGLLLYVPRSKLGTLDVRGCWLLTKNTLSSFCKMHPRLEVIHEQIQELNADQSHRSTTSSASPLKFRQKKGKLLHSPNRYPVLTYVDERIKYGREELLNLQLSQLADLSLSRADELPEILKRE